MRDLTEYLPPHLAADPEVAALERALTAVLTKFDEAKDDTVAQLQLDTATWGLDRWERAYGITPAPGASPERRREAVLARIRSARTATVEAIRNLAESFSGGQVEVTEHNSEYSFEVKLVGRLGIPEWYDQFRAAMSAFAPAHLQLTYSRRYLTVAEVDALTVAQLNATPLDYFIGGI